MSEKTIIKYRQEQNFIFCSSPNSLLCHSFYPLSCLLLCLFICLIPSKAVGKSEAIILEQLNVIATELVQAASRSVTPQKDNKKVQKHGNAYVASYVEIDQASLKTILRKSKSPKHYVGLIKYDEHFYECQGYTAKDALQARCMRVRSRKLTEIISYDGTWRK